MRVSIYNIEKELLVQSIGIHFNMLNALDTLLFRCPYCGLELNQIQGTVTHITPGLQPTEHVIVINRCGRCGMRYVMQESLPKSDFIETTLTYYENPKHQFGCFVCRAPLIVFDRGNIILLRGMKRLDLPASVVCPTPQCGEKFFIRDMV